MEPLEATVYLTTESQRQQFDVLSRALEIFNERTHSRGDLWAEFDVGDALHNMRSKLSRLEAAWSKVQSGEIGQAELEDVMVDDGIDLINYAVFLVRHVEGAYPNATA